MIHLSSTWCIEHAPMRHQSGFGDLQPVGDSFIQQQYQQHQQQPLVLGGRHYALSESSTTRKTLITPRTFPCLSNVGKNYIISPEAFHHSDVLLQRLVDGRTAEHPTGGPQLSSPNLPKSVAYFLSLRIKLPKITSK